MNIEQSNYPPHLLLALFGAALAGDLKTAHKTRLLKDDALSPVRLLKM